MGQDKTELDDRAATGRTSPESAATAPVVVAMLTFRRPSGLARALPAIVEQLATLDPTPARLLVVDNDPAGSARSAVEALASDRVDYLHEPRPGIAAARNAALAAAGTHGALVFIDDDEVPAPGWLLALVTAWRQWGCAAVAGPTRREFEADVPLWVRRSTFFVRVRRPNGARVAGAATDNILFDLGVLTRLRLVFDERFGLSGGSDTMITRTLSREGEMIRWCDDAEVVDLVPAVRTTRSWVLRRSFRTGTTWSRVHVALHERPGRSRGVTVARQLVERVELSVRGLVKGGRALGLVSVGRLGPGADRVPAAECALAASAGMLAGAWGAAYTEYRRLGR